MSDLKLLTLNFLKNQPQSVNSLTIAKGVGLTTTREINPTIYSLLSARKVTKVEVPNNLQPFWKFNAQGDDLEKSILSALEKSSVPLATKELRSLNPSVEKAELNALLYSLAKDGVVVKTSNPDGTNPTWSMKKK